jgi:hypothetical protein
MGLGALARMPKRSLMLHGQIATVRLAIKSENSRVRSNPLDLLRSNFTQEKQHDDDDQNDADDTDTAVAKAVAVAAEAPAKATKQEDHEDDDKYES